MVITNPEHYEACKWCFDNKIFIYPKKRGANYILVCVKDGVGYSSMKEYKEADYQQIIWDFYLYLYNKYNNATN